MTPCEICKDQICYHRDLSQGFDLLRYCQDLQAEVRRLRAEKLPAFTTEKPRDWGVLCETFRDRIYANLLRHDVLVNGMKVRTNLLRALFTAANRGFIQNPEMVAAEVMRNITKDVVYADTVNSIVRNTMLDLLKEYQSELPQFVEVSNG